MSKMKHRRFASGHGELPLDAEQPFFPRNQEITIKLQESTTPPNARARRLPKAGAKQANLGSPRSSPRKQKAPLTARQVSLDCPKRDCVALVIKIVVSRRTSWELDRTVIPPVWRQQPNQVTAFDFRCGRGHKSVRSRLSKRLQKFIS
jgi:hypothetical protein